MIIDQRIKKIKEALEEVKVERGLAEGEQRQGGVLRVGFSMLQRREGLTNYRHWRRRTVYKLKDKLDEQGNHPYGFLVVPKPAKDFDSWFATCKRMKQPMQRYAPHVEDKPKYGRLHSEDDD